ncbi:MAG TPA: dihydroorotate dehydrogenase-like protein [Bacteroidales bacterium]
MAELKTKYMGIELKNPIIIGASNIVTDIDNLKRIEKAGAAAIVYKSIFEEQTQLENLELSERKTEYSERNAEMISLYPESRSEISDIMDHLVALKRAKDAVSIPVFASINAILNETWVDYAKKIEDTGVNGLELNFYSVPEKFDPGHEDIEENQIKILRNVKAAVKIPVSVKLSSFHTNPLKHIADLENAGADAFVLFNRLFQPDIDIHDEEHHFPYSLSNSEDNRLPLRFAGLLFGNTGASICTNTGIMNGSDVIKMLLAGADCVQIVSTVYLNQIEVISSMLKEIEKWMNSKGYKTIDSFRGKLSKKNSDNKLPYHRAQYMDFMMTTSQILKKYKIIN